MATVGTVWESTADTWTSHAVIATVDIAEPVKTDSPRTHVRPRLASADALVCLQLNTYLIMLEYSNSYETYRICSQQYLDSIWIVWGCMGSWGWGGVGGDKPVKTDSRRTRADALKYILYDVRIFRQLWNLQDMFTIFTFDLNSFWVYGVLGVGVGGANTVPTALRLTQPEIFHKHGYIGIWNWLSSFVT